MKLLTVGFFAILLVLQYRLWAGEGSYAHISSLQAQITQQQSINEQLTVRNQRISREIASLKNGLGSIEQKARSELGLIKPGETFYVFVE